MQESLTYQTVYYSFLSGAQNVIENKHQLNKINVFPVADGDTGNNLSSLMQAILDKAKLMPSAKETMDSIAQAALLGARGNSGIIFAQYISGFSSQITDDVISLDTFTRALKEAFQEAYQAILEPVEGTMITLMRDFASAFESLKSTAGNLLALFQKALTLLKESLRKTPELLQVLQDNDVVDAGAKGFVHFVEGVIYYLETGKTIAIHSQVENIEEVELHDHQDLTYRYCTEAMLKNFKQDLNSIKSLLSKHGNSMVVAGNQHLMKVHIHTNAPDAFFQDIRKVGTITHQRVDDMVRQHQTLHERSSDIAIITDSIADLPSSLMDQYQIHLLPIRLRIEESEYLDKVTIAPTTLYAMMNSLKDYPTTSLPSPHEIETLILHLKKHYKHLLFLTVSSKMSGTHNAIETVAKKIDPKGDTIHVFDTKKNSGAEGLLVYKAAQMVEQKLPFESIVNHLYDLREKTTIFVSVQTLKYMVKSGRVKKVTGAVAKVLNLKPVVSIDIEGNGNIAEKALSVKGNTKKILELVRTLHETKGIETYSIVHSDDFLRAKAFEAKIQEITQLEAAYIMEISSVIALNAGIGAVGISLVMKS